MDGRAAHRLSRILATHLDRIGPINDTRVVPVEFVLLGFVGGKVLKRPEIGTGIEGDDGEVLFRQQRCQCTAAGACANDREVDFVGLTILPHRNPGADTKNIRSCLLYTSPSPRDRQKSRMPSSA